eukprot:CAMPEP_0174711352 /NCGR_PEP_ID=MMETSP1094-20130205/12705_1 /TAXON_ID=156173 /ORGANISM="Chrysochromulina brevifilum, Strain UTEX LB 985" /LENGTH=104 /DNA_ID=CAMNT_0015910285 /DNA_START=68 /DNA_END=382 /DNA_ORIENTATION=-
MIHSFIVIIIHARVRCPAAGSQKSTAGATAPVSVRCDARRSQKSTAGAAALVSQPNFGVVGSTEDPRAQPRPELLPRCPLQAEIKAQVDAEAFGQGKGILRRAA